MKWLSLYNNRRAALALVFAGWLTGPPIVSAQSLYSQQQNTPITIAVISDLNGSYGSTEYNKPIPAVMSHITGLKPDLVISTGDMIAGQRFRPLLKRPQLEAMWAAFHSKVSDPVNAAGIPLAITAGNHDASLSKKFRLERDIYAEQWEPRVPKVNFVEQAQYPFYYAFEIKDVLFVGLDASIVGPLSAKQFSWLRSLLEKSKGKFRQTIVFSHLPIWPVAQNREHDIIGDSKLEALLVSYQVGLYLSGHHHAYFPGYKDGMLYVSQARLGSGRRKYIGSNLSSKRGFTLIKIDANNRIQVNGYNASNINQPIDIKSLPREIKSQRARLIREDLIDR